MTETLALNAPTAALQPPHLVKNLLSQAVFYPAHAKRSESASYAAARKDLVKKQDRPSLVCGVRQSTLKVLAENPSGATQMQTHHRIVGWAFSNAVDLAKFNARIVGSLHNRTPNDPNPRMEPKLRQVAACMQHAWILLHDYDEIVRMLSAISPDK